VTRIRWAAVVCVAVLAAPVARAQSPTGTVAADAVVVTVGMTINTLRDLDFGTVIKGVATTVQPTAATAGAWQVTGSPNAFVIIAFTLPTQLTNIQALPGSTMPISFNATAARWNRANNNAAAGTPFNPAAGAVGRLGPPPNPNMYVWIGGTVNPAAGAKPGIYQGTVILSLVYQ
jgi:hypothetical protein